MLYINIKYGKMIIGDIMEILILASGSKGNAISITNQNRHILVDVGISYQSLKNKLLIENINIDEIDSILITHEHYDHIRGLKQFLKQHPYVKIYLTKGTYDVIPNDIKKLITKYEFIKDLNNFEINNLTITPYMLSHDASEPVGFVINNETKKMVIATDTGYIDESYFDLLKNADLYILESNHCPKILMDSRRPFHLKKRIIGEKGHLSNDEASWLINEFIKEKDEVIWAVAHISEECNTQLSIEKSIVKILDDPTKIILKMTSQETTEKIVL